MREVHASGVPGKLSSSPMISIWRAAFASRCRPSRHSQQRRPHGEASSAIAGSLGKFPGHLGLDGVTRPNLRHLRRASSRELEYIPGAENVQPDVVYGQCSLRARFCDIGVRDARAVDYVYATAAEDLETAAGQNDRGVLVDAEAELARIVGDSAKQPAEPPAFGEVLVDDDVADEPEAGRHVEVADPVRLAARALNQHGIAHDRGPCRGPGDEPAALVDLAHAALDGRVADLARDAELVAAGKEHARSPLEAPELLGVEGLGSVADVELGQVRHAEVREGFLVGFEVALRLMRGHGREDELAPMKAARHLAQDHAVTLLVLAAADDDEGSLAGLRAMHRHQTASDALTETRGSRIPFVIQATAKWLLLCACAKRPCGSRTIPPASPPTLARRCSARSIAAFGGAVFSVRTTSAASVARAICSPSPEKTTAPTSLSA